MLDNISPSLHSRLKEEVENLLKLTYPDERMLMEIFQRSEKEKTPAKSDEMFPLFFGLVDKDYEGGIHRFPGVPGVVYYLGHYWIARKHAGS